MNIYEELCLIDKIIVEEIGEVVINPFSNGKHKAKRFFLHLPFKVKKGIAKSIGINIDIRLDILGQHPDPEGHTKESIQIGKEAIIGRYKSEIQHERNRYKRNSKAVKSDNR